MLLIQNYLDGQLVPPLTGRYLANVEPAVRGLNLAQILIERAKQEARNLGYSNMIAPVRPTRKHLWPLTSMAEYIEKRGDDGEIFDPWLRQHLHSDARLRNVCPESVRIRASLGKWREWTGLKIENSAKQILPGGLSPLEVNQEKNLGEYCEPNVWIEYKV